MRVITSFKRRRKKKCISKLEKKKKTSFRRTTNYIYAFSRSFFISFLSFAKKDTRPRRARYSVLFLKTTSGISVATYITRYYKFPLFYTHLHICLAFTRTFPFILLLSLSPSLPDLSTYLLSPCCTFFRQQSNVLRILRYVHFSRQACGERE